MNKTDMIWNMSPNAVHGGKTNEGIGCRIIVSAWLEEIIKRNGSTKAASVLSDDM